MKIGAIVPQGWVGSRTTGGRGSDEALDALAEEARSAGVQLAA